MGQKENRSSDNVNSTEIELLPIQSRISSMAYFANYKEYDWSYCNIAISVVYIEWWLVILSNYMWIWLMQLHQKWDKKSLDSKTEFGKLDLNRMTLYQESLLPVEKQGPWTGASALISSPPLSAQKKKESVP